MGGSGIDRYIIRVNKKLELELNLNLRDQLLEQQKCLLQVGESCFGKQRAGPLSFEQQVLFSCSINSFFIKLTTC